MSKFAQFVDREIEFCLQISLPKPKTVATMSQNICFLGSLLANHATQSCAQRSIWESILKNCRRRIANLALSAPAISIARCTDDDVSRSAVMMPDGHTAHHVFVMLPNCLHAACCTAHATSFSLREWLSRADSNKIKRSSNISVASDM